MTLNRSRECGKEKKITIELVVHIQCALALAADTECNLGLIALKPNGIGIGITMIN